MKLLLCRECGDVVKLLTDERWCRCGRAHGYYRTDVEVVIMGTAEVLLLDNGALHTAMVQRHYEAPRCPTLPVSMLELALPAHPRVRRI
jgi:hypothetical protein